MVRLCQSEASECGEAMEAEARPEYQSGFLAGLLSNSASSPNMFSGQWYLLGWLAARVNRAWPSCELIICPTLPSLLPSSSGESRPAPALRSR